MTCEVYRYLFDPSVASEDVAGALLLAVAAAESLHGEAQVRLDARCALDEHLRVCQIDAGTDVGRDLNRLFVGFLRREVEESSFRVERRCSRPCGCGEAGR